MSNKVTGDWGEKFIAKTFACPKCKNYNSLKRLPNNFKCVDIVCDFCGYLAQVKTVSVTDVNKFPKSILGAAWKPQKDRMRAGIYFPLYIVLKSGSQCSVFYLPTEFQLPKMFKKRNPLSDTAKRAGWQGFVYDFSDFPDGIPVRVWPIDS